MKRGPSSKTNLIHHIYRHHNGPLYECKIDGCSWTIRGNGRQLKVHQAQYHGDIADQTFPTNCNENVKPSPKANVDDKTFIETQGSKRDYDMDKQEADMDYELINCCTEVSGPIVNSCPLKILFAGMLTSFERIPFQESCRST